MSKQMTGSSLLGPLSSTWYVSQLCSDRPETLQPDILAKNCSDFSRVHQAYAVTFRTSNVWVYGFVSHKLPDEWVRVHKVKSTWHTISSVWCEQLWSLVQPPRWRHSKGLSVSCQCQIHRCWDIHCSGSMMVQFNKKRANEESLPLETHRPSSESRWQSAFPKVANAQTAHIDERYQHFAVLRKAVCWVQLLHSTGRLKPWPIHQAWIFCLALERWGLQLNIQTANITQMLEHCFEAAITRTRGVADASNVPQSQLHASFCNINKEVLWPWRIEEKVREWRM